MKNDFLTFIFHFFKKCKIICLRNEVIFIFQNHQKMNDPKTHALQCQIYFHFSITHTEHYTVYRNYIQL